MQRVRESELEAEREFVRAYAEMEAEDDGRMRAYVKELVPSAAELEERARLSQDSDRWKFSRGGFVTASNAGALSGVSSFATVEQAVKRAYCNYDTLQDVADPRVRGQSAYRMERGKRLESVAFAKFQTWLQSQPELKGLRLETAGTVHHALYPIFSGSPDGLLVDSSGLVVAVLEIKSPGRQSWSIRPEYKMQMNQLMWIFGARTCYFVELLATNSDDTEHRITVTPFAFEGAATFRVLKTLARVWRDEIAPRRLLMQAAVLSAGDMFPTSRAALDELIAKPGTTDATLRAARWYRDLPNARYKYESAAVVAPRPAQPAGVQTSPDASLVDQIVRTAPAAPSGLSVDDMLLQASVTHILNDRDPPPEAKRAKVAGDGAGDKRADARDAKPAQSPFELAVAARDSREGQGEGSPDTYATVAAKPAAAAKSGSRRKALEPGYGQPGIAASFGAMLQAKQLYE